MKDIERFKAAAQRWSSRAQERTLASSKVDAGKAVEAETPERVQQRLVHLAEVATKAKAAQPAAVAAMPLAASVGMERIIDKSDFLDINFLENAMAVSRSIGRVNIRNAAGRTVGYGTGFMVSPSLLMTNNHVLDSLEIARHSEIEFDFQNDRYGRPMPVAAFALDPVRFFVTDDKLDFSLVAVRPEAANGAPLERYGWSRLLGMQGKALIGEPLNIIQHPRGEMKQLVLRSNQLVDVLDTYLHYVTDTEPGSSGAAVMNDQWELVALHHSGVPATDSQGNLLAQDGSIWNADKGEDALQWVANEGIRVSSLVAYIRSLHLSGVQARLRDELLNDEPPSPVELAQRQAGVPPAPPAQVPGAIVTAVRLAAGGQSLSVPITLHIQFGAPTGAAAAPAPAPAVAAGAGAQPAAAPGADVEKALAELAEAAQRPYYDAQADEAAVTAYYGELELGDDPAAAYLALSSLVSETHRTRLGYAPSSQVYPWVDLQPPQPGQKPALKSIYSGKLFDAREFIELDLEVDRRRAQLRESMRQQVALGSESAIEAEAFLEAAVPYNCEHVVPQSWFSKREPMRGDLHHLFACESGCNSFRGNIPYFDFADFEEVVRGDCGKREEGRFEPGAGKGTVARATLYFLLRYPGQINRTAKEYTDDRLRTLLAWHKKYPPGEYEKHRNLAIHERQGNRNPLIDYPEWVDRIDFTRGLG